MKCITCKKNELNPHGENPECDDCYDRRIGIKYDEDKLDYTLLPKDALDEVVKVLMYGAKKYSRDNWYKVDDGRSRYNKAALRHLFSEVDGDDLDESTYFHLAHAAASCLFALHFALKRE